METSQDKWIVFESIFEGVDLNINFNNWTGSFIESNDNIEIISFEFKFNKRMFKVTKEEKRSPNQSKRNLICLQRNIIN